MDLLMWFILFLLGRKVEKLENDAEPEPHDPGDDDEDSDYEKEG